MRFKMDVNYRVDLRKTRGKNIDNETRNEIYGEINELTMGQKEYTINFETKKITLHGTNKLGHSEIDTWELNDYIKTGRQYNKNFERIHRQRQQYGIDTHNPKPFFELTARNSIGKTTKGVKNYNESMKRILKKDKDTGNNRLRETYMNNLQLRRATYNVMSNVEELMKVSDPTFDMSKYKTRTGRFRSRKLENELYDKLFNTLKVEEFDQSPPPGSEADIYGFIFENYDIEEGKSTKQYMKERTDDELKEMVGEYYESRLSMLDYKIEVNQNTEEEIELHKMIRKGLGKKT